MPVCVPPPEAPSKICQRAGNKEVFLDEPQPLTADGGIVRVQHTGQRFGCQAFRQRADEVTGTKALEIEVVRSGGAPEPQRVDRGACVADDRSVERDADQGGRMIWDERQVALAQRKRAGELDFHSFIRTGDLPWIGAAQPVIRLLVLPSITDRLFEDPILVAQAITHRRQLEGGHRIQEAGCETPEATIAQTWVGFLFE